MAKTAKGMRLLIDLMEAGLELGPEYCEALSLLARHAASYARRQEAACNYEWACGDKWDDKNARLESRITEIALGIPGVVGVVFSGDPRGYCVRLKLENGYTNTWGGDGFGIA